MKRILLSFLSLCAILGMSKVNAQCTVSNLAVEVTNIVSTGSGCTVSFNLSYQQEVNNGNKTAYMHLWLGNQYHTPTASWPTTGNGVIYSGPSKAPVFAQLQNTVLNYVIENNNTPTPSLGSTYYPDASVTVTNAGSIIKSAGSVAGTERIQITGQTLTFSNCSSPLVLNGDVWATQAANNQNVHCATQGLSFVLNDPRVFGQKNCTVPRTYLVNITTTSATPFTVSYNLYKGDNDGIFEPGAGDVLIDTETGINISASSPYTQNNVTYPGNNTPGDNSPLWIEVIRNGASFGTVTFLDNGCVPLPVSFKSFSATRNKGNVAIKWETASESNNKGFNVQRNISGTWETIAFVFSAATGGNSSETLAYNFNDANSYKGVSQYRIQQVDLNGTAKLSEIRSVKGEAMAAKLLVYPNPSTTGKVSVVFEDGAAKNVQVSDMSGRVVKSVRNVQNNVTIEGLESGVYSIQVTDLSSAVITVEKVIIKKR